MAKNQNKAPVEEKDKTAVQAGGVQEQAAPVAQAAQEGTTPPQNQQGPEQGKKQNPTVKATNGVNLRIGPHKSFNRLTVLANGAEVEILPLPGEVKVPGWYLVTTPGYTGWVDAEFLRIPEEV